MLNGKAPHCVALALGANLGNPAETFQEAINLLAAGGLQKIRQASLYISKAEACYPGTADFTNSAVTGGWTKSPQELLQLTQSIEIKLGRPAIHDSRDSRTIDIDILLFGNEIIAEADLIIPHPRMYKRLFVLQPLVEIAADWIITGTNKTVKQTLNKCLG